MKMMSEKSRDKYRYKNSNSRVSSEDPKRSVEGLRRIWRRKNDHPTLSLLNPPNYQIFLVFNLVL